MPQKSGLDRGKKRVVPGTLPGQRIKRKQLRKSNKPPLRGWGPGKGRHAPSPGAAGGRVAAGFDPCKVARERVRRAFFGFLAKMPHGGSGSKPPKRLDKRRRFDVKC